MKKLVLIALATGVLGFFVGRESKKPTVDSNSFTKFSSGDIVSISLEEGRQPKGIERAGSMMVNHTTGVRKLSQTWQFDDSEPITGEQLLSWIEQRLDARISHTKVEDQRVSVKYHRGAGLRGTAVFEIGKNESNLVTVGCQLEETIGQP